jgi:hypothetical protein
LKNSTRTESPCLTSETFCVSGAPTKMSSVGTLSRFAARICRIACSYIAHPLPSMGTAPGRAAIAVTVSFPARVIVVRAESEPTTITARSKGRGAPGVSARSDISNRDTVPSGDRVAV